MKARECITSANWSLIYTIRISVFVAFCGDNATTSSKRYFENHYIVLCAKPKEVNPVKLNFCMTNKCLDITQIYIKQQSININVFGHRS